MRISFGDVVAAIAHVDDPDVLERVASDPALRSALDMCRPPNWQGTGMGRALLEIARAEGIPLAWAPRREIIAELGSAADQQSRRDLLAARTDEILVDCADALAACSDPYLANDTTLASRALDALRAGHHEAAMALAVALGEPLAAWAATPRVRSFDSHEEKERWEQERKKKGKYKWAEIEIAAAGVNVSAYDFKHQVLIAPIPKFFTPWWPESGSPVPEMLSRHVVAHQPTPGHMSRINALLATMLIVSILREMQEWVDEVRSMDGE